MIQWYKLDEQGDAQPCSREEGAALFEAGENFQVQLTDVGELCVSTVFLGFDHQRKMGAPAVMFETQVFGRGSEALYQDRYTDRAHATAGHFRVVELVKAGALAAAICEGHDEAQTSTDGGSDA